MAALKQIALDETAEAFLQKTARVPGAPNTAIQEFAAAIERWIDAPVASLKDLRPLFHIFRDVMLFEINRPFEVWYEEPEKFPRGLQKAWQDVEKLAPVKVVAERDEKAFEKLWTDYLEEGKRWEKRRQALAHTS